MSTAQKILDSSFGWIGIKAAEEPLTGAMAQDGLDQLNNFLAECDAVNILTGIEPVTSLDTDLQEPRYATGFLQCNVAASLAAFYGAQVSQSLAAEIIRTTGIVTTASNTSKAQYPATLPMGSGNYDDYDIEDNNFFPEQSAENF